MYAIRSYYGDTGGEVARCTTTPRVIGGAARSLLFDGVVSCRHANRERLLEVLHLLLDRLLTRLSLLLDLLIGLLLFVFPCACTGRRTDGSTDGGAPVPALALA